MNEDTPSLSTREALRRELQATERGPNPPRGVARVLFRMPLILYRLNLGWLLGNRFLRLTHTGRKSGLPRQTVLEVVDYDAEMDSYYVASGFGRQSQWFKNVQANPRAAIQVGFRQIEATAEVLDATASGEVLATYARQHPTAARALLRVLGYEVDGSEEQYRHLAAEHLPVVAFHRDRILRQTPTISQLVAPFLVIMTILFAVFLRHRQTSKQPHNRQTTNP